MSRLKTGFRLRGQGRIKGKIGILSLGCPRNLVDSESILGRLILKGHRITDIHKAATAIVNTCAFTEEAKKESIDAILDLIDLKNKGRIKKIIVCGCLPQRYKYILAREFPQVDVFIGTPWLDHGLERFALTPRHYAYLKICEGCINRCSFCVVPKIKGRFASIDMRSLLGKAKQLDQAGIKELNIIGQDITGYGLDLYKKNMLVELLKDIAARTKNIRWLRLLYLYPSRISDELIAFIRDEPKVCKYIDMPIQHINSRILKLMRRQYAKGDILRLIAKIRAKIPQAALRTSVIVGFPSETEAEFQELLDFIKEVKFERLGAFIYSREEGSPAYNFRSQIPKKVKVERFDAVMSGQQEVSRQVNAKFLGRHMQALVDSREKGYFLARTQYDAPEVDGLLYLRSRAPLIRGDLVKVKIIDTLEYDLVGEVKP